MYIPLGRQHEIDGGGHLQVILFPSSSQLVGVGKHVLNLARLLYATRGLDLVICPEEGWLSQQLTKEGIPYVILNLSYKPKYFFWENLKVLLFIWQRPATVLHLHGRFPLFITIITRLICKNLKVVATVHQFSDTGLPGIGGWKSWLETYLLGRLDGIICVSRQLQQHVVSRLGKKYSHKVDVIYNWIDPNEKILQLQREENQKKTVISVCAIGRLSYEKGFDVLIRGIGFMRAAGHTIVCDIFGEGAERATLTRMIASHGLQGIITLQGVSEQIPELLPQYHALIIPSRQESFGLIALEGYYAGVPVIASNTPGLNEVVIHGATGLLFEVENEKELVNALLRILGDRQYAQCLIEKGKLFLRDFLPSNQLVEKYQHFYG